MDPLALVMMGLGLLSLGIAVRKRYFNKPKPSPTVQTVPSEERVSSEADALHSPNRRLREAAVRSLSASPTPADINTLIDLLGDEDYDIRAMAADGLARVGSDAVPELVTVLRERRGEAREMAAHAAGQIGHSHAIPGLKDALHDESALVRRAVVEALAQINHPRAVPVLIPMLKDQSAEVRQAAEAALRHIGTREALAALPDH